MASKDNLEINMNQIGKTVSEQAMAAELGELSRKTGLVVDRPIRPQ
jgi:hypothetical protein